MIEAEPEPQDQQTGEGEEPPPEVDPTGGTEGIRVDDQFIDNPYDPVNFKFIKEEDNALETQDEHASFNILSFVTDTEEALVLKLASVRDKSSVSESTS